MYFGDKVPRSQNHGFKCISIRWSGQMGAAKEEHYRIWDKVWAQLGWGWR